MVSRRTRAHSLGATEEGVHSRKRSARDEVSAFDVLIRISGEWAEDGFRI